MAVFLRGTRRDNLFPSGTEIEIEIEDLNGGSLPDPVGQDGRTLTVLDDEPVWGSFVRGLPSDAGTGGYLEFDDAEIAAGGDLVASGGNGALGFPGASATLIGGSGDDGDTNGGMVRANPGLVGSNGKVTVRSDGSTGSGLQLLGSDDDGKVVWRNVAAHVGDGASVDDLRDALIAAGLMEPA